MSRNIYTSILKAVKAGERVIIATVTDDSQNGLRGEKIAFFESRPPVFTDDELKGISRKLTESALPEKVRALASPLLEKIKTTGGVELEIYLEPVVMRERLIIFGAGHIARPLAEIAKLLDFEVTVIDDREDLLTGERFPEVDNLVWSDFADYCSSLKLTPDDYLVIATRGHQYDYQILKSFIRSKAKYIGMIGSRRKARLVFDRLREVDGIPEQQIERVYSPIGLYIGSETPQEIAVSIMAEVVMVRRGKNEL